MAIIYALAEAIRWLAQAFNLKYRNSRNYLKGNAPPVNPGPSYQEQMENIKATSEFMGQTRSNISHMREQMTECRRDIANLSERFDALSTTVLKMYGREE